MSPPTWGRLTDAPATFVLVGARVVDPLRATDAVRDVAVRHGVLVDREAMPPDAERIDGRGLLVAPGFVDLHTHLREPGGDGETIESGARAAARGGFTTICAMPNSDPPTDDVDRLAAVATAASGASCRVRVVAAVTVGRSGERLTELDALTRAGAVAASDDGASVPAALIGEAAESLARRAVPLFEHAEDPTLASGAVMRAGPTATRLGLRGWPSEAEAQVVERDLSIAATTGARLHLTHVSTRATVEAVRSAKARGARVTADVTPHHLAMTDRWVAGSRRFAWEEPLDDEAPLTARAYDGTCRVNPPLASRDDAGALLDGLADGTIDAIATDHAPHPPHRTVVPFGEASPGMIGLETALSLGLAAVAAGRLALGTLLAALSTRPAAVIREPRGLDMGAVAELVVVDADARWRVERSSLASLSANTPLIGMELPGVVRLTVAGGRVTYRS